MKFFKFIFNLKNKGFSLIETAIAILIFSILSISIVNLLKISLSYHELQTLKCNQNIVKNALIKFFKENNRLPKPSFDFNGTENTPFKENKESEIKIGYVPYKTLGLTFDESSMPNGKPFTYVVHAFDCIDLSPKEEGLEPEIDIITLKIYSKSKLFLENKNQNSDISFALTTSTNKIEIQGPDVKVKKNGHTIAMSRNAIEGYF